ncbi:MAG: YceI family protein [Saprospiraceae bacterium]|nr:YceI family protein [Saprospiraceae bacterium]
MKRSIILTGLMILLGTSFIGAQSKYNAKKADFTILGTSNLHDWEMNCSQATIKGDFLVESGALTGVENVVVEIPVKSLKSEKGSIMDGKTYDALKAKEHGKIYFTLSNVNSITKSGAGYNVKASGNLKIAGYSRSVTMTVFVKVLSNGDLEITGSKDLKMTDYKVDPPTAMFGALTTGDDVTVKFNAALTSNQLNK